MVLLFTLTVPLTVLRMMPVQQVLRPATETLPLTWLSSMLV